MLFATILKICSRRKSSTEEKRPITVDIPREMVIESHMSDEGKERLNAMLYRNLKISSEDDRIKINQKYWRLELDLHKNSHQKAVECMKIKLF